MPKVNDIDIVIMGLCTLMMMIMWYIIHNCYIFLFNIRI